MDHSFRLARFHPPEYRLHKYWARKPHNILRALLREFTTEGDLIVDPFCGSGVLLAEASALGRRYFGFDLNPTAVVISRVTAEPPPVEQFSMAVEELLVDAERHFAADYHVEWKGAVRTIHHCVHATIVHCNTCGSGVGSNEASVQRRRYACPNCGQRLLFNLEHLLTSNVIRIAFSDGTGAFLGSEAGADNLLASQTDLSSSRRGTDSGLFSRYDAPFLENRRILAFKGMRVAQLFTARAFRIICSLADRAHATSDEKLRDALLIFLTASAVQFSRLIPYRNNLTTGGPGWTVPGFWVPPLHLETNPFNHLRSRIGSFTRGLSRLEMKYARVHAPGSVRQASAVAGLDQLISLNLHPTLVFLDPPYGDNVPYLEFSTIWNAILREKVEFASEIVVSDRTETRARWPDYSERLYNVAKRCAVLIREGGLLAVTFNNLETKAWFAIISALQRAGFSCIRSWYQVPAVVSTKAQLASDGSYVGDFLCVYKLGRAGATKTSPSIHRAALEQVALRTVLARGGRAPRAIVMRAVLAEFLQTNLPADVLPRLDDIVANVVDPVAGFYEAREEASRDLPTSPVPQLDEHIKKAAFAVLHRGPCTWHDLYGAILESTEAMGLPTPLEVRRILAPTVVLTPKRCSLRPSSIQPSLL